jgi:hypothetical protein
MTEKYRGDHIGSLLRPEAVPAARRAHDAGDPTDGVTIGLHVCRGNQPGIRFYTRIKTAAARFKW